MLDVAYPNRWVPAFTSGEMTPINFGLKKFLRKCRPVVDG